MNSPMLPFAYGKAHATNTPFVVAAERVTHSGKELVLTKAKAPRHFDKGPRSNPHGDGAEKGCCIFTRTKAGGRSARNACSDG